MLRPYICATCEKVIIEQVAHGLPDAAGPATLISLFSKLYVRAQSAALGEPASIPSDAVLPRPWAIYTEWETEPGDENKRYQLLAQVLYPDGKPFGEPARVPVNVKPNRRSQVVVNVPVFPIGQQGTYTAHLQVEVDEQPVGPPVDLKIEVVRLIGAPSGQPLVQ